ncbi:DUF1178 family protein [Sphingobium subterraneum]|uniref:DUF1178 family protein n=1 Tax=Sphingobium subterraneum TaxID=627688 RepID=A0A841IW60_9SPHN|nr:DUF1178 family protein [Sphingobium subterraneum]MBB6122584.1 hypothetical protein [Sphingobium subterraneum]
MIVFDLKCAQGGHVFEAWFGSSADYEGQRERGLLVCPLCGDADIGKAVMAPAVPVKGNQRSERLPVISETEPTPATQVANAEIPPEKMREMLTKLAKAQTAMLENSQWVGRDFAEQARAMHYGERDAALIHGEVDAQEARALMDEGVEVAPLLLPVVPPRAAN